MLFILAISCLPGWGETIRLKNGRIIFADSVREVGGRVEYTTGENTFAIPKSSVISIDTGGRPNVTRVEDLPIPAVNNDANLDAEAELTAKVIVNRKVDTAGLSSIEVEGKPEKSGAANFIAAKHESSNGSPERAERYIRRARTFLPDNLVLMTQHAIVLLKLGRTAEAAAAAEQATRVAPNSGPAFGLLGYANLQMNKTQAAIRALKRSLDLQPDSAIEQLLDKAQREAKAEADFSQEDSLHFTLRYEGAKAPVALRRQILDTLESQYRDLVRDLGVSPRESISVVLYTEKQFFDVTQAAEWVEALNDGKLRMPIRGISEVNSEFARVLKHELTHSFISQMTRGRCPTWLNEGVAQMMEPRSMAAEGRNLAMLYGAERNIPLNQLEGSFVKFSAMEATLAYAQSLAAVEYIRDTYGMGDVATVLRRIGEGQSTESALRSTIHSGYAQLEQELSTFLRKSYGG